MWRTVGGNQAPAYEVREAQRHDVVEQVEVTGTVVPVNEVELAFERAGRVIGIAGEVGTPVRSGDVVASLSGDDERARVGSAQAALERARGALASAQATLDDLRQGATPEELAVARTTLENAKSSVVLIEKKQQAALDSLYAQAPNDIQKAYTAVDSAIHTHTAPLFRDPLSNNPQLDFLTSNLQAENASEAQYVQVRAGLDSFSVLADAAYTAPQSTLDNSLQTVMEYLSRARALLQAISDAVNSAVSVSSTSLESYKVSVNTARTDINTIMSTLSSLRQDIATQKATQASANADAQNAVASAQAAYDVKVAGSRPAQIRSQEAAVAQARSAVSAAEADLASAQSVLAQTRLIAPFDGVITKKDIVAGQIVSPNTPAITIIGSQAYQIEAQIPELEIAKLKGGDSATATFDAFGAEVFPVRVARIDPAQTTVDGVSRYRAVLFFETIDPRIRSGMTATLNITTARRDAVLAVPRSALVVTATGYAVRLAPSGQGKEPVLQPVVVGLLGPDFAEITQGLSEGQSVVVADRR